MDASHFVVGTKFALVFIFHDPGARNHLLPLVHRAERDGVSTVVHDLRGDNAAADDDTAASAAVVAATSAVAGSLVVFGCSTNRCERAGIREAKARGLACVQYIDPPGVARRLDELRADEIADLYLLGAGSMRLSDTTPPVAGTAVPVGSTHIEQLLASSGTLPADAAGAARGVLETGLGCAVPPRVVTFFLSPREPSLRLQAEDVERCVELTIEALAAWATGPRTLLLLRPHPRTDTSLHARLETLCSREAPPHLEVLYDRERRGGANDAVIRASDVTLSLGSTVATESIVNHVPHAFVQLGWPHSDAFLDTNYAWLDVPRISDVEAASESLAALAGAAPNGAKDATSSPLAQMRRGLEEAAVGSIERAWGALVSMVTRPSRVVEPE